MGSAVTATVSSPYPPLWAATFRPSSVPTATLGPAIPKLPITTSPALPPPESPTAFS